METVKIFINDKEYEVPKGISVIKACEKFAGIFIPRFCYHESLEVAGNCRMCLVEIKPGPPKPSASCATKVAENMQIFTDSSMVTKAREDVMSFLLANHPLDCPVCDQGGECDLQDQAYVYGKDKSLFGESKRAVEDKNLGPLIKTKMNRCIHCTRCIRFAESVAGTVQIGLLNRGNNAEISSLESSVDSELSGNLVDICPVGAINSAIHKGKARPWELKTVKTIDVMDSLCSSITIQSHNNKIIRVMPLFDEDKNEHWISDKTRYAFDGLYNQRLDACYIKNEKSELIETNNYENVVNEAAGIIKNSNAIGVITGKITDLQTFHALKKIIDKKPNSFYSCFEENVNIIKNSEGNIDIENYIFNSSIKGIDETDLIILVGVNPKKDSPVLNTRILRAVQKRNIKVYSIDEKRNLGYKVHFKESKMSSLDDIISGKSEICNDLKNANKPMFIIGQDALIGENGANVESLCSNIAEKYNIVREDWNGYNFLHKHCGSINGLFSNFYNTSAENIKKMCDLGKIDCLITVDTDEIDTRRFSNVKKIISFSTHGSEYLQSADIIFPALTYVEKESLHINLEGMALSTKKACNITNLEFDTKDIICKILSKIENRTVKDYSKEDLMKKIELDGHIKTQKAIRKNRILDFDRNADIKSKDYNFYMNDLIARNSPTMAKCTAEKNNFVKNHD